MQHGCDVETKYMEAIKAEMKWPAILVQKGVYEASRRRGEMITALASAVRTNAANLRAPEFSHLF